MANGYEAIVLAAGQGRRMQASRNKVLLHLQGRPVLSYSVETFLKDPACQHVILVIQAEEAELIRPIIKHLPFKHQTAISVVVGGKERQDSVFAGLQAVKSLERIVMVHDGARPFVTAKQLQDLYQQALKSGAAILGVPVKDTIKKVLDGKVVETIPRETLWQVQTPQAFLGTELALVHQQAQAAHYLGTDDASLIEVFSERSVEMVLGSYENIKLTTPEDMFIGETIAKRK